MCGFLVVACIVRAHGVCVILAKSHNETNASILKVQQVCWRVVEIEFGRRASLRSKSVILFYIYPVLYCNYPSLDSFRDRDEKFLANKKTN